MTTNRLVILGALLFALALSPSASAGVNFGFSVNVPLPHGVQLNVTNFDPYYVGRVYYQPLGAWRPVYSFPVSTPYGVVWAPYVYDGGRIVCHDYIPGPELGYGRFVVEGRGYYNPAWRRAPAYVSGYGGYGRPRHGHDRSYDRDWRRDDGSHSHGRGHGKGHGRGHGNGHR